MEPTPRPLKIWLACPGVGHIRRGYESFTEELFAALRSQGRHRVTLFQGAGEPQTGARRLPCIPRTSALAGGLARFVPRLHAYAAEQVSFGLGFIAALVAGRPDAVVVSDRTLARMIHAARFLYPRTALVFSNGAPCAPPFGYADRVQHVTPVQHEEALAAGEPAARHRCVPYGCRLDGLRPDPTGERRRRAREWLELKSDDRVVVSVGHVSYLHKRMDYVVREVAAGAPDSIIVLAGQRTEETPAIARIADELFPGGRHRIISVPAAQIGDVYAAADVFVLGSLSEAFGRVVMEALAAGLPVLVHDSPVMRFVAGANGRFGDFTRPGALAELVRAEFARPHTSGEAEARAAAVERRFSWEVLLPEYEALFQEAVASR